VLWSGFSITTWLSTGNLDAFAPHRLSLFSVVAISGAYLYCISEQIRRWYTLDLSPADLYWLSFRFVAAIPLGWTLRYFVAENLAIPACFLVAAFPTNTLLAMMRRLLSQTLKVSDIPMSGDTQLKVLSGIDVVNAERFASENITTIAQLAYYDPVELTMRTNFEYSYIVDCVSQALLFIYVRKEYFDKLSLHGIRGAYEMRVIRLDLKSGTPEKVEHATQKLRSIAEQIAYPSAEALKDVALESGGDPCTVFIYESWMSPNNLNA
jgi:hypothetical protein